MNISRKMAEMLLEEKIISDDEIELYEYSINALLEMAANIIATLILGLLLNKFLLSILFLMIIIPFRSFIGGWHANSTGSCFIISILYYLCAVMLPEYAYFNKILSFGMYIILTGVIWFVAPVDCLQKPVSVPDKIRMKKYARICLVLITLLFCFAYFSGKIKICIEIIVIFTVSVISLVAEKIRKSIYFKKNN